MSYESRTCFFRETRKKELKTREPWWSSRAAVFLASASQASTFNQIQSSEFCIITLGAFNDCIPADVSVYRGGGGRSWVQDNDNQTRSAVKITQRIKLVDVFTLSRAVCIRTYWISLFCVLQIWRIKKKNVLMLIMVFVPDCNHVKSRTSKLLI